MSQQVINIPVSNFSLEQAIHKINESVEGKNVSGIFFRKTSLFKGEIEILIDEPSTVRQAKGHGSSRYRGVFWVKAERKWRVQIGYKGKRYLVGRFDNEIEAAKAYDAKAIELMGADAYLNFPTEVTK
ncbi:MAG: AP2 domain-containing protein [Kurthia sp.]